MSDGPARSRPTLVAPAAARPRLFPALRGRPALALGLAAVLVAAAFVAAMLAVTDGHFVPQVVDLYVVCQYARAIAEGHPFRYHPGEPPSSGATSVLYTAWLALAHAGGARGEALVAFAIATGAALFVASVVLAYRLGRLLGSEREGWLAAGLVLLGGPVVWGFLYGSDIALFLFLALWLLERMAVAWTTGALGGAVLAASLIALARPEGLAIALGFGAACALEPGRARWRRLAWVPALLAVALLVALRAWTGAWIGSSVADKSLLANYGLLATLGVAAEYAVDVVRGLLLGFYPSQAPVGFARGWASLYFPPLGLLLVLAALVGVRPPARRAARAWAAIVALVGLALAPSLFAGVHFNRYVLWALPGLLALVAAGLGAVTRLATGGDARLDRSLFRAGAGLLLALGALSTTRFAVLYAEMAADVYRRDVAAAEWIRGHLSAGTPIANLATSVEYLTGHRSLNLHGVTTPAFFGVRATEREAGALEALARLPEGERPGLLLVARSAAPSALVRGLAPAPPLFATASGGDEIELRRLDYGALVAAASPRSPSALAAVRGRREVDRLNVGDAQDEASHGYRAWTRLGGTPLGATVRLAGSPGGPLLADAGRAILGQETFELRTEPGRDLLLVMRTAPEMEASLVRLGGGSVALDLGGAAVRVSVNGAVAAESGEAPGEAWHEWVLPVPGRLITADRTRFDLLGRYASFRYWAYQ